MASSGNDVIGAEVRRLSDGSVVGYTDRAGTVTTTQPGGSDEEYYANASDANGYDEAEGDVRSGPITVETYEPIATSVDLLLGDGQVFDADEYETGDLAVRVLDDRGRPFGAGESVSYKIYPSEEDAPATYATALTDEDGVAVAAFESAGATGSYTFAAVLSSQEPTSTPDQLPFTTGEASLLLSPKAGTVEATAGGQIDYFGRLLVDGEPLGDRRIDLGYERGVEVVPGNQPDAAIVTADGRRLRSSVTTNRNGSFRVTVDDQDETPQASEVGGLLTAVTGDTVATEQSAVDGNAATGTTSTTQFGSTEPGTASVLLGGFGNGPRADRLRVTGPATLADETIEVFRVTAKGKRVLVTTRTLDSDGDRPAIRVADRNGSRETTYVVRLLGSARVEGTSSNTRVLR